MFHKGTDGYWRDTTGTGENRTTKTFGHYTKRSKVQAMVLWRAWKAEVGQNPRPIKPRHIALGNVIVQYLEHAQTYYRRKDKSHTGESDNLLYTLKPLDSLYGDSDVNSFGTIHMQGYIDAQIKAKVTRQTINKRIGHIKRMFKWCKSNGVVPAVFDRIRDFEGLKAGRSDADEAEDVTAVPLAVVEKTQAEMPKTVADMVRVQYLATMRPQDVCGLDAKHIKHHGKYVLFSPPEHKTAWRGTKRRLWLGPAAMKILKPYITAKPFGGPLFVGASGTRFTTRTYRQAIWRACDKAFTPPDDLTGDEKIKWRLKHRWSPNQLRHTRLTEIESEHGIDSARAVAGHTSADTTAVYLERDDELAKRIMLEMG